jgi:hypothetical protein
MKTQECRAGMLIPAENIFMIICGHLNMSANARAARNLRMLSPL